MSLVAVVLVLIASFTHASWNFMGKREVPSVAFFLLTTFLGGVVFLPIILTYSDLFILFPIQGYAYAIATGFFLAVYFTGLAGAYRTGDMSVAYPLARSSPIIVVTFVSLVLGRSHQISVWCYLGIGLVVTGCFLIPLARFSDFRLKNYLSAVCLLALLAAIGTSGYSIIDDEALRFLRNALADQASTIEITLVYGSLEMISTAVWLFLFVLVLPGERAQLTIVLATKKRRAMQTGITMHLTYVLILIAMNFSKNISYIVAFRQTSILIGTFMGIMLLKETAHRTKLLGVIAMFMGLILVGVG